MVLKKIRNKLPLSNDKYQIADKLMTFDGPDHAITIEKMQNSSMTKSIQKVMSEIANVVLANSAEIRGPNPTVRDCRQNDCLFQERQEQQTLSCMDGRALQERHPSQQYKWSLRREKRKSNAAFFQNFGQSYQFVKRSEKKTAKNTISSSL